MFEDYNYDMYNKYILIDPDFDESQPYSNMPKNFVPQSVQKSIKGKIKNQTEDQSISLTSKNLEESCQDPYEHDVLNVQTENEKKELETQKAMQKAQLQAQRKEEELRE